MLDFNLDEEISAGHKVHISRSKMWRGPPSLLSRQSCRLFRRPYNCENLPAAESPSLLNAPDEAKLKV
jgi:hypothetical protein